jgi:hypothetical protein
LRSFNHDWFFALTLLAFSCGTLWTRGPDGGTVVITSCSTADASSEVRIADPKLVLTSVRSLVFDASGKLFVLDRPLNTANGKIHVFSPAPDHQWQKTFGDGFLGIARDFTLDTQGRLQVLSQGASVGAASTVRIYQADGTLVGSWNPRKRSDNGITSDGQGHIYVSGYGLDAYTEDGVFERELQPDNLSIFAPLVSPSGLVAAPPVLWVTDMIKRAVVEVVLSDGHVRSDIGSRGTGPGQFNGDAPEEEMWGPDRVVIDSAGNLYANDPYQKRIQKFSTQGAFLGAFIFNSKDVSGLAIEPQSGNVYVGRGSAVAIVCASATAQ